MHLSFWFSLEHCQLTDWVCSDWSNKEESCGRRNCTRTKIKSDLPKFEGDSCEEVAGCNGPDCWMMQTEEKSCGTYDRKSPLALLCTRVFTNLRVLNPIISKLILIFRLVCHNPSFVYNWLCAACCVWVCYKSISFSCCQEVPLPEKAKS